MNNVIASKSCRRNFVKSSLSILAGAGALAHLSQPAEAATSDEIVLGVQSYTYRNFDLEPTLKRLQELGVKNAEFYSKHIPPASNSAQLQAILKLCKEYQVTPVAFGVQRFSKDHDANKKFFEFGKALGLKSFSADPDPDSFDSLDKLCEEFKIAVAIHPHGPAGKDKLHRWYSAEIIMAAVKDHHPLIGSCLDTGHLIRSAQLGKNLDPAQQIRVMGKRNFGMHLKDHDNQRKTDVVFGKGVLNVTSVLKALKEVGFKGMVSIEYEANPNDPSPDLKACVEIFNKEVKSI